MEKEAVHGNFGYAMPSQRLSTSIHVEFWDVLREFCHWGVVWRCWGAFEVGECYESVSQAELAEKLEVKFPKLQCSGYEI